MSSLKVSQARHNSHFLFKLRGLFIPVLATLLPMELPFEPMLFGIKINVHLILEYGGFIIAFRYYVFLRKRSKDQISQNNRLSIILGAALGALIGSRVVGFLEFPSIEFNLENALTLMNTKTIMGGLFGGLLGVELAKKIIGERQRSGDLFTLPIVLGIFIGRVGCFLAGTNEFTYGKETTSFLGLHLGDRVLRHPLALYEMVFLAFLFLFLKNVQKKECLVNGELFKIFMIAYFSFRFLIEFLKPNEFFVFGLSSIQILCIICLIYYRKTILGLILKKTTYAR